MRFLFSFFVLLTVGQVYADDVDPFEDFYKYGELTESEIHKIRSGELFYGDAEFGFVLSKGNFNASSLKLKSNVYQDFAKWRNQFKFNIFHRRDKYPKQQPQTVSSSRFFMSGQSNYKVGEKNSSLFAYFDYEHDEFRQLTYEKTLVTGYGNRLYNDNNHKVDIDIGPGVYMYRNEKDSDKTTGYLLRLALRWEYNIAKYTRFTQHISAEQSFSGGNSRVKSESALISRIFGELSLKFSYLYRYNTQPESGKKTFDSELSATFVYSF